MGMSFPLRLRHPFGFFVELPQIHALLVQPAGGVLGLGVARALRVRASGRRVRAPLDGGGSGGRGSRGDGDVDHRRGAAGLLWEAQEDAGCGGEEGHWGDFGACGEDFVEGRECCGRGVCCFGLLCSC
ncbi:hypothetical protein E2542_SST09744 [Spatholobus suberectus]|nr:hypothetical protein E2542_SST09744 [Spatholobus suberectus]